MTRRRRASPGGSGEHCRATRVRCATSRWAAVRRRWNARSTRHRGDLADERGSGARGSRLRQRDALLAAVAPSCRTSLLAVIEHDRAGVGCLRERRARHGRIASTLARRLARCWPPTSTRRPRSAVGNNAQIVRIAGARPARDRRPLAPSRRELSAIAASVPRRRPRDRGVREVPMAVIGMGKLGGDELNYASDVDVMFVHDGDVTATRPSESRRAVTAHHERADADGIVFRTDADLRPEGRVGRAQPQLDAYESYWDRWARTWELQALIKARPVAGDTVLGEAFIARAEPYVWPDVLDPDAVRDIRAMKARTEEMLRRQGLGRPRDQTRVRRYPRHRVRGTAVATRARSPDRKYPLADHARRARRARRAAATSRGSRRATARRGVRLAAHRRAPDAARRRTTDAHAPAERPSRTCLARVLGFRDRRHEPRSRRSTRSSSAIRRWCGRIHEKLFFAPLLDTLAGVGPVVAGRPPRNG